MRRSIYEAEKSQIAEDGIIGKPISVMKNDADERVK